LKNILVTNGFINKEPLEALLPFIDAVNIDFKAYDDEEYRRVCGGNSGAIYDSIKTLKDKHVEVTFLVVPGLNDDTKELKKIFKKLAEIQPDLIIHITRYFPHYRMIEPATEISQMTKIQDIARTYFKYVYLGNV
jgi:pyruvate formate lyase activating enzyme